MEMAVTVGCPAVGKVEVAVVADMQDCTPVIDWVAKPWRAGEVAPMKVRVVQQVHEKTLSHWRTLVVQRNFSTGVDGRWWSGRACEVRGIRKEIKPAAEMI